MRIIILLLSLVLIHGLQIDEDGYLSHFELPPQHPIENFTMNFMKGLDLGKVSFNYIPCIRTLNSTLLVALDIPLVYQQQGADGVIDSVTYILSNLFDINTTCQVSIRELTYAYSRYIISFQDDHYWLAVLREFPGKIERWIEQTVHFKSCFYWGWWGCAGRAAGRFANIVFNATPKHKPKALDELVQFELPTVKVDPPQLGETIRLIINATLNGLETSGLLSQRNASATCKDHTEDFYESIMMVIDMIFDSHDWKDAIYQLLYGFKSLNPIYRNCKNVLLDFVQISKIYLSTLSNWKDLINHIVFRCKPIMSRGMVTFEALKGKNYEDLGAHIGYLLNIILWS